MTQIGVSKTCINCGLVDKFHRSPFSREWSVAHSWAGDCFDREELGVFAPTETVILPRLMEFMF